MTITTPYPDLQGALTCFQSVDVDCRLRVLWRAYQSLGQTFASSAPVALFSQSVQILIKQLNLVPQEEQLAILQDILGGLILVLPRLTVL
ncbi:MAG: orange carotenoid protein N-terminal domain-containing protein [Cyanobacteriota bacterium]|nr:orange carotenoid protein N-terminal domain-containing protein [Cyanobacteriota bacterium]